MSLQGSLLRKLQELLSQFSGHMDHVVKGSKDSNQSGRMRLKFGLKNKKKQTISKIL